MVLNMLILRDAFLMIALLLLPVTSEAQSRYENPVVQKTGETSGHFKTYHPVTSQDTTRQRVTTQHVVLLTAQSDLEMRVKVEDLATFIHSAEVQAYLVLAKNRSAMATLAQFNCYPGKCDVKLASQGQAEEATMQELYVALSSLTPPKVTGAVIFQVRFNVAN